MKQKFNIIFLVLSLAIVNEKICAQDYIQEEIFVHTTKNYYHAGELMYYSVYVLNAETHKPVNLSRAAYFELLDSLNKPVYRNVVALKEGRGSGSFAIPSIMPGVFRLRAYTNWMRNYRADNYFQKEIAIVNGPVSDKVFLANEETAGRTQLSIDVNADKKTYDIRSKAVIEFNTHDEDEKAVLADFSVSVYRIDSFTKADPANIASLLTEAADVVDNETRYAPEYGGRIITGRITERSTGTGARGINVYLSVPGYSSGFHNTITDSAGNFRFVVRDLVPSGNIIVQTDIRNDKMYAVEVNDPFSSEYIDAPLIRFKAARGGETLAEQSIAAQVEQSYHAQRLLSFKDVGRDTIPFYGKADFVYHLDDYVRFSKMEEVFREFIGPVAVSKRGNSFQLAVYELQTHNTFSKPPLVLIDGYPVVDIDKLFLFDPLKVKTIEVLNRKYIHGNTVFEGIVNLITYSADMNGYPPDEHAKLLPQQVVQNEVKYVMPDYDNAEVRKSRRPDFRNVLYWSPMLKTDKSGKARIEFFTSDLEGSFVVIIQAITAEGKLGSGMGQFEVRGEK